MSNAVVVMAGADVSGGLRDALIDNLNNILSPQAEVRRAAEDQIHVLEVTEGERRAGRARAGTWAAGMAVRGGNTGGIARRDGGKKWRKEGGKTEDARREKWRDAGEKVEEGWRETGLRMEGTKGSGGMGGKSGGL